MFAWVCVWGSSSYENTDPTHRSPTWSACAAPQSPPPTPTVPNSSIDGARTLTSIHSFILWFRSRVNIALTSLSVQECVKGILGACEFLRCLMYYLSSFHINFSSSQLQWAEIISYFISNLLFQTCAVPHLSVWEHMCDTHSWWFYFVPLFDRQCSKVPAKAEGGKKEVDSKHCCELAGGGKICLCESFMRKKIVSTHLSTSRIPTMSFGWETLKTNMTFVRFRRATSRLKEMRLLTSFLRSTKVKQSFLWLRTSLTSYLKCLVGITWVWKQIKSVCVESKEASLPDLLRASSLRLHWHDTPAFQTKMQEDALHFG